MTQRRGPRGIKTPGLKAEIAKHSSLQARLEAKIEKLEAIQDRNPLEESALKTYREILVRVLLSKAEVVSKIGKKKR